MIQQRAGIPPGSALDQLIVEIFDFLIEFQRAGGECVDSEKPLVLNTTYAASFETTTRMIPR